MCKQTPDEQKIEINFMHQQPSGGKSLRQFLTSFKIPIEVFGDIQCIMEVKIFNSSNLQRICYVFIWLFTFFPHEPLSFGWSEHI